jgi:FAD/FMN-containing dehydrogenase
LRILVRRVEEEAGYVSVRPVVQQEFLVRELTDMVIRVTGKNPARVQQILRAGTVVYNGYRYWWAGFEVPGQQLTPLLATFPEDDPSRTFRMEDCVAVFLEVGGGAAYRQIEIGREQAERKTFWRQRSVWTTLRPAKNAAPVYAGYSYALVGDVYRRVLPREEAGGLLQELLAAAPRALRKHLVGLAAPSSLLYLCPRR